MTSGKKNDDVPDDDAGKDRSDSEQAWRISKLEREVEQLRAANEILQGIARYLVRPNRPRIHLMRETLGNDLPVDDTEENEQEVPGADSEEDDGRS